jgi:hypothetical protein
MPRRPVHIEEPQALSAMGQDHQSPRDQAAQNFPVADWQMPSVLREWPHETHNRQS